MFDLGAAKSLASLVRIPEKQNEVSHKAYMPLKTISETNAEMSVFTINESLIFQDFLFLLINSLFSKNR